MISPQMAGAVIGRTINISAGSTDLVDASCELDTRANGLGAVADRLRARLLREDHVLDLGPYIAPQTLEGWIAVKLARSTSARRGVVTRQTRGQHV